MKEYTLSCFKNFKCKMGRCTDNCCIGWGIDIDDATRDYYKNLSGQFGDFIRENIDFENSCIKMKENGRCPFLNEKNLCDIIINSGEEHISYICTNHPKFFNEFNSHIEMGYGLCCEEATQLLMAQNVLCETFCDNDSPLFSLRNKLFDIIYKNNFTFKEKLYYFYDLVYNVDELLFFNEEEKINPFVNSYEFKKTKELNSFENIIDIINLTEPIGKEWEEKFEKIAECYCDIEKNAQHIIDLNKEKYEKLLYYYTFRYLLKDIYENDILSKATLILSLVLLNIIFDTYSYIIGNRDYDKNTVLISKQIEYSEGNLDILYNAEIEFFVEE